MNRIMEQQMRAPESDSDEKEREYVLALLRVCIGEAFDNLKSAKQELEILQHRRTNASDREEDDTRMAHRPPPMSSERSSANGRTGPAQPWQLRSNIQAKVFTNGLSKPTMTIEEFAEYEMALALERQQISKEREAEMAKIDPESEEAVDAATLKARNWDDYKEEVVKGSGNTGLKSMFDVKAFQQENPDPRFKV